MNSIKTVDLRFDVTKAVSLNGTHTIAASLFVPPEETRCGRTMVLFCLHGGSYSRAYYDMNIPGRTEYSFSQAMAARGFIVLTVDDLGVGESSRPADELDLTMEIVASANADVADACRDGLKTGSLVRGVPPVKDPLLVGLGHSMGGMLTIYQQAKWRSFDAVGVLGFSPFGWGSLPLGLKSPFADAATWSQSQLMEHLRAQHIKGGYLAYKTLNTQAARHYHHWEDVPEDVIAADEAAAACLPGLAGVTGQVPGLVIPEAGEITCPVFTLWGEREPFEFNPHRDVTLFRKSRDVTVFVLPRSGHSHNLANTRHQFWNRLAAWIPAVLPEN